MPRPSIRRTKEVRAFLRQVEAYRAICRSRHFPTFCELRREAKRLRRDMQAAREQAHK